MHREISYADQHLTQQSNLPLYLFTGLLGLLIGADFWPNVATWFAVRGWRMPSGWEREVFGYRIALLAAILGGARVLYTSLESLFEGRIGADLALAIACIAAILFNKPLVAAEVVFIGMLGECLEGFTFARTQRALRGIVEIFPRRCWLLRDGQEVRVFAHELKVGDLVVVKPGARIPADGIVREGRSALDASALTGESVPRDVGPGDEVWAGSLNQFGALTVEAVRVAEHTVVGRVIELTARALRDKAQIERVADKLARVFLPVVLSLAGVTLLVGILLNRDGGQRTLLEAARRSIDPTLAVLVVACPCALILATPAAIIAALGRLAGTGVLIKGGSALERLAVVQEIAFDKTGTLTQGRLSLGDIIGFNGVSAENVLRIAAAAEQKSEHPLAQLILQEARKSAVTLDAVNDFTARPGAGVIARTMDAGGALHQIIVGTRRLLEEHGLTVSLNEQTELVRLDAAGQTLLLVALDGALVGVIGARDTVRDGAHAVVEELRALGINASLLTGDRRPVAESVGITVGVSAVHAELLPTDKSDYIERRKSELRQSGTEALPLPGLSRPLLSRLLPRSLPAIAMVGDGVNDAPALACADVGLAVGGTGADVAAEAGDIVLMGDPLAALPLLVRLSRETVRIIQQNILIFAFAVNSVGIVLTAWLWPVFAPPDWLEDAPLAAVIYHQFGSLAVLLNSMRLLWFERAQTSQSWMRFRQSMQSMDHWMSRRLDPDEGLHWLGHHWQGVCVTAIAGMLAIYLSSGFVQIGPDEVAVVRRFGKPRETDLGPGLHWCWPWPIEQVDRLHPDRIHMVAVGLRFASTEAQRNSASGVWSSEHRGQVRLVPDEAVMITGDGNLVELQAIIRYTIVEPRVFLFEVRDLEETLRATAESVLRETVAERSFIDLLTVSRGRLEKRVIAALHARCRLLGANGLGIAIDGVALPDVHPPLEVVQAYHEVARAMEGRDRVINDAKANAIRLERASESEALKTIRVAEAERNQKVSNAEAEKDVFLARLNVRTHLPLHVEWRLTGDAVLAFARGEAAAAVQDRYRKQRQEMLTLQATLTDFRLFWDLLGRTLGGREKIIIDADKVPGRRHLLLFDPDQWRVPTIGTERAPPKMQGTIRRDDE